MKGCIAVLVLLVAVAAASLPGYHTPGFRNVPGGKAAPYRNDLRQVAVNHQAEYVGSGTGTARYDGVPGTGNYFRHGYNDGGYPHGGYTHGGYSHGGYGHDSYGYAGGYPRGGYNAYPYGEDFHGYGR